MKFKVPNPKRAREKRHFCSGDQVPRNYEPLSARKGLSHSKSEKEGHLDLDEALRLIARCEGTHIEPPARIARGQNGRFIQKIIDKLCYLTMTDGLTGLPNRLYLMDQLKKEIERARRTREPCSLVLLDLDRFKDINDSYGHAAGDYALLRIAKLLIKSSRVIDVVARYGGEEFALILPDTNAPQAHAIADRIREAIVRCNIDYRGAKLKLSASVGIAVFQRESLLNEVSFIELADEALLEAKREGRNRVCIFRENLNLAGETSQTLQEKRALLS